MDQKQTFKKVLAYFAVLMIMLPPVAALNSFLTNYLNNSEWWRPVQTYIVPFEARLVAASLKPFGIETRITPGSLYSTFYMVKNGSALPVYLSWNCLGWQGILLLILSLIAGFRSSYTALSRIETVIFGLAGTLLINILRMGLIALGIYFISAFAAEIVHNYIAAIITLLWLLTFWWFSYSYILTNKNK